jgi:hypothetical protein
MTKSCAFIIRECSCQAHQNNKQHAFFQAIFIFWSQQKFLRRLA